ncbi:MAG: GspMb/PilO family protein [Desulfobacteraceae bacterium]|nr:GspMb/PilO family protein [Desulfobacteraceae bacterium]
MNAAGLQFDSKSPVLRYGVLAIAFIIWYSFIFDPLTKKIEEVTSNIDLTDAKILKTKKDIKRLHGIDQQLKQAENDRSMIMKRLIPGQNPQLVASNLQDIILKKASDAGMDVLSYRTFAGNKWHDYQLGTATLITKASTKSLTRFLMSLDSEDRIIRVNNLNIIVMQGNNPYIRVNMDVDALYIPGVK